MGNGEWGMGNWELGKQGIKDWEIDCHCSKNK
jgi:hypothetical protein